MKRQKGQTKVQWGRRGKWHVSDDIMKRKLLHVKRPRALSLKAR